MALKTDFDAKYNIVDEATPQNACMSGHYKKSHAYFTLRSCLPVVLTNVIDTMTKYKNELQERFGEDSREELKKIIGMISKLKYELQTDKPFELFMGDEPDGECWNLFITHLPEDKRTFYRAASLHAECYMYRKLQSFFENSVFLKEYDYFMTIKKQLLNNAIGDIHWLANYTRRTEKSLKIFLELLKLNLWSNRDEFITPEEREIKDNNTKLLAALNDSNSLIIVNAASAIWNFLTLNKTSPKIVDIVCDNAGYELFTDMILAEYMIEKGLATKVRFHIKAHPWFISDCTAQDMNWMLQTLSTDTDYIFNVISKKFAQFFEERKFELAPLSYFWTSPYAFHSMREIAPDLYESLTESKLIIFKGDLNYRKLVGDICWNSTKNIEDCLKGFRPTNFCIIRTVKAEVICGLPTGLCDQLTKDDPQWMTTGNYGLIQFVLAQSSN